MHGPRAALALPVLALVGIALAGCGAGKAEPAPAVDCDSIQTFGYIRQQMNAADTRIDSVRTSLPDADPATRLALSQEYSSLGSEYGALAHLAADEGGGGGLPWRPGSMRGRRTIDAT